MDAGTTETMADRSPPDRLDIASFKQRNSAITEDLERQEVEPLGAPGHLTSRSPDLADGPAPGGVAHVLEGRVDAEQGLDVAEPDATPEQHTDGNVYSNALYDPPNLLRTTRNVYQNTRRSP